MSTSDRYSLRIVVQRIVAETGTSWRLLAYGGRQALGYSDFRSLESLSNAFRSAIPGFDETKFSPAELCTKEGPIVFTEELQLDDLQLSILDLS
jgi:hypothetical protein